MNTQFEHIRIREFIWIIFLYIVTSVFVMIFTTLAAGGEEPPDLVAMLLDVAFYFVLVIWLLRACTQARLEFTSFFDKPLNIPMKDIVLSVVMLIILALGVVNLQSYGLSYIAPDYAVENWNMPLVSGEEQLYMKIYQFIAAVILAPIIEELVFRGFLLNRLSYKWGITKAIIISSTLFGVLHYDIIGAAMFGGVCSIFYLKTKSLFVPIMIHMINNFTAVIAEVAMVNGMGVSDTTLADIQSTSTLLWGIGLTFVSCIWLVPFLKNNWNLVRTGQLPPLRTRKTPPNVHM
ncbi:CPBP family intramembrane glutamic endopeptidase [Priestia taiwanensis]|uniref:AbrB family transcriptional regulator n=1 Tax=Priestia taiwanensis TaxID=1347902 RepID=A0A917ERA1_9BACI|nr:type II CAAX endopeptidase family protein [Priestia taiwanensis]MBM7363677.1 membrane protease YdiL (CAAX protease family) [Priestia taiwanensis]GGE75010.1 AbrB family transcriptional regulator [Priestia taiwanensis]